jgi:hypothetical protein
MQRVSVSGDRGARSLCWIAFALALVAVAAVRVRLLGVPLERDEGEYAYLGQLLLQGVPPYAEAWNMKFPGIYAVYALLIGVGGANVAAIHAGLLVANAWNSVAVALLGRRLLGTAAGVVAGAGFAAMSLSTIVNGLWSHAEPFALSFALAGLLLAYGGERVGRLVLAGLLLGTAVVVKQNAGPLALFGAHETAELNGGGWRVSPRSCSPGSCRSRRPAAALALAGAFDRFWLWTFVYARAYGSQMTLAEGLDNLAYMLPRLLRAQLVWWLAAAVGAAAPLWSREVRARAPFLFGFLAAGALAASFGLYFRAQYFVPLLPAIALLAGAGAHALGRAGRARELIAAGVVLVGLATPIGVEAGLLLRATPDELTRPSTQNPSSRPPSSAAGSPSSRRRRRASPSSAGARSTSARPGAATGYIYMYPLMEPLPLASAMQDEMIAQLEAARPEVLVFVSVDVSWLAHRNSPPQLLRWFNATAARDYEVVARVEILSAGQTRWLFGADARTTTDARYWVAILRRKVP